DERCEIPHEKLLNFREQESEFSFQESKVITSRRLIGYSKLLKIVMDQLTNRNISHLDMDKFCIDDLVANQAFINMLQWHPGLREEEKSPFVK
ncbi:protein rep, partial [Bacillus cereus]